ncbi:histidine phosphatase family protein [Candidatus Kaiserbacteria bacterium]|nr:histidine phosphatase family protein [Candidatus Kaiserbacteria bacterium]
MEVYFVRHGETDANVARRHQVGKTPLTKLGREQAKVLAQKAKTWSPTHLISSSHVRALETSRIISEELDMIPETSRLFTELHRPSSLHGYHHYSLVSLKYLFSWFIGREGGDIDGIDGESYKHIRKRIQAAREYLESLPEDSRVIVVSHSIYINLFITHVCKPSRMSIIGAMRDWIKIQTLGNTEVRKFVVNKGEGKCGWHLTKNRT